MTLLAASTVLWLALGLAVVLLFTFLMVALLAVYFAVFDGGADDSADVQRFIELTEEARRLVPAGLPLFDSDQAAATTAAIVRFQAKKEESRRALWGERAATRRRDRGARLITSHTGRPSKTSAIRDS
jgi:hypothetical protein